MNPVPNPDDDPEFAPPTRRPKASGQHIVILDPNHARPVSQYSPEGEIRMMGDFASGLSRHSLSRPLTWILVALIVLPILLSAAAVITTW